MLLSEAIRLGATLGPQTRHFLTASGGASCALGAAARAIGLVGTDYQSLTYDALQKAFPVFQGDSGFRLMRHITNLNDFLYLSREEIADWIVENNLDCEAALGHLCDRARNARSYQGNESFEALPKRDLQQRRRRTTNVGRNSRSLQYMDARLPANNC